MRLKSAKKIVSFIIVLSMIATLVPSVFAFSANDFTDFPKGWSKEAMTAAVENGLLKGRTDTEIAPEGELTRAEMVTIINRAFGATVEADITSYIDVHKNDWFYHEIAKGVNMRIIEGDSASIMRPDDAITREEVFAIIARVLVLEDTEGKGIEKFSDGTEVSDWAKKYIYPLIERGYINGDDTGKLLPKKNITREEFAQVMYNIIKTYYTESGTYTKVGAGSALIRKTDVELKNIVIEGDLIIGDGVGYGSVTLTNVIIKGRLICRGGEKAITLVNSVVEGKVVINDVNGVVHFNNYRSIFKDIQMNTQATFLPVSSGGGGGGSRPSGNKDTYYTIEFYNGMVKDAAPIATKKIIKDGKLASKNNVENDTAVIDKIYTDKNISVTGNETKSTWTRGDIYNEEYTYETAPGYIYYNKVNNQWEEFTDLTVISKDIVTDDKLKVYYAYKNIAFLLTDIIPIEELNTVSVMADYSDNSRAADTVAALLINGYDQLSVGKTAIDNKQRELYTLLGSKTNNMISPEGKISTMPVSLKIADVIPYAQIKQVVESYVNRILESGTEGEIKQVFGYVDNATLVNYIIELLGDKGNVLTILSNETVKNKFVTSITSDNQFIASLLEVPEIADKVKDAIQSNDTKSTIRDMINDPVNGEVIKSSVINVIKNDSSFDGLIQDISKPAEFKEEFMNQLDRYNDETYNDGLYNSAKPVVLQLINSQYPQSVGFDQNKLFDDVIGAYTADAWPEGDYGFAIPQTEIQTKINNYIDEMVDDYLNYNESEGSSIDQDVYNLMDGVVTTKANEYIDKFLIPEGESGAFDPDNEEDNKILGAVSDGVVVFIKDYLEDNIPEFSPDPDTNDDIIEIIDTTINDVIISLIEGMSNDELADIIVKFANDKKDKAKAVIEGILTNDKDTIFDLIVSYINDARSNSGKLASLKTQVMAMLEGYQPYKDLMKTFENKKEKIKIANDNMAFVSAIADQIEDFSYADIKPMLLRNGYGPIIELMGKNPDGTDVFETVFDESKRAYVNGLRAELAKVQIGEVLDTTYTASLSVNFDIVSIIKNMYSKFTTEAKDLFKDKSIYKYDDNQALQDYANIDWFSVLIKEVNPGEYQVNDFFSMYESMVDIYILMDKAISWYGNPDNYDESYDEVKEQLAADMAAYLDGVVNIVDQITTGQAIGGKYTINQIIAKVQELNKIADALGESSVSAYADTIKTLVDTMTNILTELGEGNLPGGYSLDNVNALCDQLKSALENINEEDADKIDAINNKLSEKIRSALKKLGSMFDELDESGTIRGKSIEALMSKFAVLETIYQQYGEKLNKLLAVLASADVEEAEIDIDYKRMIDVFLGADANDRYVVDDIINIVPKKHRTEVNEFTETADETFIADYYKIESGNSSIKVQRTIR